MAKYVNIKQLVGEIIGPYTVLSRVGEDKSGKPIYKVKCNICGSEFNLGHYTILESSDKTKCRYCDHKKKIDSFYDVVGKTIGKYNILSVEKIIEVKCHGKGTSSSTTCWYKAYCNQCGFTVLIKNEILEKELKAQSEGKTLNCVHQYLVPESLSGMMLGKYKILEYAGKDERNGKALVKVECTKCGWVGIVSLNQLKSRILHREEELICSHEIYGDITGQTFGKYLVLEQSNLNPRTGRSVYKVHCNICGWEGEMDKSDIIKSMNNQNLKCLHDMSPRFNGWASERIKNMYAAMISRCYNPEQNGYENYGGKGIRVCLEWYDPNDVENGNFAGKKNFNDFAVSMGFTDNLSIDRIDSNGNYEPSNVQFVTNKYNSVFREDILVIHITNSKIDYPGTLGMWDQFFGKYHGFFNTKFATCKYPDFNSKIYAIVEYIVNNLPEECQDNYPLYKVYFGKPIGYDFVNEDDIFPTKIR